MLLVVGFGVGGADERSLVAQASGWRGLVGGPRPSVVVGQREIVVLKTPSLAQRVAANGGLATQHQEHEWTRPRSPRRSSSSPRWRPTGS